MRRKQAKTGGSGEGQFNRTTNKENSNNNDTDKENTQHKTAECRQPLSLTTAAACSQATRETSHRPTSLQQESSMTALVWNTLLCLARLG